MGRDGEGPGCGERRRRELGGADRRGLGLPRQLRAGPKLFCVV